MGRDYRAPGVGVTVGVLTAVGVDGAVAVCVAWPVAAATVGGATVAAGGGDGVRVAVPAGVPDTGAEAVDWVVFGAAPAAG